jgi:RNA polymerase primary sigma factor
MNQATTLNQARPAKPLRVEFVKSDDPLAAYFSDIRKMPRLTLAEEQVLAVRIQGGDQRALKTLVEANLKFVVAVCRNYSHQGMSLGDLINEGNLGLIKAAQRFDGSKNFKFISYAVWWIRQGILTALAEQSRVLNISPGKVGLIHRIGKAAQKLAQNLGRSPSSDELAGEMRMTEQEVDECLHLARAPISLSRPAIDEGGEESEFCLPDTDAVATDEPARRWVMAKYMEGMLDQLPEREGRVIRLYYGIGLQNSMTLGEIGDRFGLTRERVRQIKEKAFGLLRHPSKTKRFAALRN